MKLLFVGDVMLGRLVNDILKEKPNEYPWGDTLSIFRETHFRVCNLECVISDKGSPWKETPKVFHFRSDTKNVSSLKLAKIDAVSLANNHTLDFGYEAMFEMLKILDGAGIGHSGVGRDFEESSKPSVSTVNGFKIGLISFTDNELQWSSQENKAGIFYVPIDLNDERAQKLFKIVKKTKKEVDFLIVAPHWGSNWGYHPQKEHIPFAHHLIKSGADLIFGHSAHIFQGIEIYQNRPILYSTGDFVDDYAVDPVERNDESFIFVVELQGKQIQALKLYPTVIRNFQARLAQKLEAIEIASKMEKLSSEFKTKAQWQEKGNYLEIRF